MTMRIYKDDFVNIINSHTCLTEDGKIVIFDPSDYVHFVRNAVKSLGRCSYCGKILPPEKLTIDHIVPQTRGGVTTFENLVPACEHCNGEKGFLTISEYKDYLWLKENLTMRDAEIFMSSVERNMLKGRLNKEYVLGRKEDITFQIIYLPIDAIKVSKKFDYVGFSKSEYRSYSRYLYTYGFLKKPLVVSKNMYLLESKTLYQVAVENGLKEVPTVILYYVYCTDV